MEIAFSPYFLHVGIICLYYAILASSWNLIAGMTGFASYSHAAFAALGAYAAGYFSIHLGGSPALALPFAFFTGAILGAALGKLCLRLSGTYLALVTLAFSELLRMVLTNEDQWTRGDLGLSVPLFWSDSGLSVANQKFRIFVLFALVLVALLISIHRLKKSRLGLHLRAILSDELAAASLGVRTEWLRIGVFSVSSAVASLAGALFAHDQGLITPGIGSLSQMFLILAMTILGGMGTLFGPVLGAVLLEMLSEGFRSTGQMHVLIFALCVLILYRVRPSGLLGRRR